jgi:hypothetical protein
MDVEVPLVTCYFSSSALLAVNPRRSAHSQAEPVIFGKMPGH